MVCFPQTVSKQIEDAYHAHAYCSSNLPDTRVQFGAARCRGFGRRVGGVRWSVLSAFARADQAIWGHRYLQGLVSNHPRKSIEPIALAHGFPIRSMQAFIGESSWRIAPLL